MNESNLQPQIEAARAYESLFVPALFGQWAPRLADAAQVKPGQRVLDVACGTGILAREFAQRVGRGGYVAGLDPNPGMLAVAKEIAPEVDWWQGTAEEIPFPDQSFDVVSSQFGLMFFQDRQKAIQEMLRSANDLGRVAVVVWDSIENIAGYAAEMSLIERFAGKAAANAVRAPFVLGKQDELHELFVTAGASSVEITTYAGLARFPNIRTMVEAELRGWLPVMGVHLDDELIDQIIEEAERALAEFNTDSGSVVFDVTAHLITARPLP